MNDDELDRAFDVAKNEIRAPSLIRKPQLTAQPSQRFSSHSKLIVIFASAVLLFAIILPVYLKFTVTSSPTSSEKDGASTVPYLRLDEMPNGTKSFSDFTALSNFLKVDFPQTNSERFYLVNPVNYLSNQSASFAIRYQSLESSGAMNNPFVEEDFWIEATSPTNQAQKTIHLHFCFSPVDKTSSSNWNYAFGSWKENDFDSFGNLSNYGQAIGTFYFSGTVKENAEILKDYTSSHRQ